ncbi:alpha/beta hydrolase [Coleofasciculus sp. FACHB-SPT9]|uniref:alpha/beta hydrolase n=1 Tax=Cyanophyceae TaxID=3028117 RepID=UPI001681CDA5|nr:alpha/beta hydrolase [Coleofasciculus sp. FACHB-SPT9]MBD1887788.1 alpha/beta hydrolase [Coleofasciculus sp. FACHB-SPT9]
MRSLLLRSLPFVFSLAAATGILFSPSRADAANTVVLKYRFLRESVSVPELTTFAETGELSSALRAYLAMAGRKPEDLRKTLTQEVKVNALILDRVLNNQIGELVLGQVSDVVHTPGNGANIQSLRGAVMSSALPDNQITLIEILENYPTSEVHVEGDRLAEVFGKLKRLGQGLPNLGDLIRIGQ